MRPKGVVHMVQERLLLWFMMRTSGAPHAHCALRRSMVGRAEGCASVGMIGAAGVVSATGAGVGPKEIGALVVEGPTALGEEEKAGGGMPVRWATLAKNSRKSGPLPCSACMSLLRRSRGSMTRGCKDGGGAEGWWNVDVVVVR